MASHFSNGSAGAAAASAPIPPINVQMLSKLAQQYLLGSSVAGAGGFMPNAATIASPLLRPPAAATPTNSVSGVGGGVFPTRAPPPMKMFDGSRDRSGGGILDSANQAPMKVSLFKVYRKLTVLLFGG